MTDILMLLSPLVRVAEVIVVPVLAFFTRISLLVFLLPGFGMRVIPVRIRLVAALAITVLLFPAVSSLYLGVSGSILTILGGEAIWGLFLGVLIRIFLFALDIVGAVVAQALSLSQIFGAGLTEEPNTTVSAILTLTGATLFLTLDFEVVAVGMLVDSIYAAPPMSLFDGGFNIAGLTERVMHAGRDALGVALSLAMPFLILNFAYNVLLGMMNKAMPQLMVTFVGMPAITFAGLSLLTLLIGSMLTIWLRQVTNFFDGGPL